MALVAPVVPEEAQEEEQGLQTCRSEYSMPASVLLLSALLVVMVSGNSQVRLPTSCQLRSKEFRRLLEYR